MSKEKEFKKICENWEGWINEQAPRRAGDYVDPDRIRDAEAGGKYGNTVDDDYLKRLNMTLNESKKVKKPDSMKLIMENFKKAMNKLVD